MIVYPERLQTGDAVALVAPSSPPMDAQIVDASIQALETMGLRVKPGKSLRNRHGFLAGSDAERAADLITAFQDESVKAVICLRGGYGAARLLPWLDFELIAKQPKILVGFSDITALHSAIHRLTGLVTFHGPMASSDFAKPDCPGFTSGSWLRTLTQPVAAGGIRQGYDPPNIEVVRGGKAEGRLTGGNLSILCSLLGTPYQPDFQNRILFLEDVDEAPYRMDRMLTHLLNAGLLQQVNGVAFGICRLCLDPKAKTMTEYRQTLEDVIRERLSPLNVPVVMGLPFGHIRLNATIPVGAQALLDGDAGDLVITEPAVK